MSNARKLDFRTLWQALSAFELRRGEMPPGPGPLEVSPNPRDVHAHSKESFKFVYLSLNLKSA